MNIEILTKNQVRQMIKVELNKQAKEFNREIERLRKLAVEKPLRLNLKNQK